MMTANVSAYDNHTAVCAEIQKELSADNIIYNVSLGLHQTSLRSVALCVSDRFLLLSGFLQKAPEHQ